MILATSKVVKIVCLQWFYLWYKVNIFTSEPACKWSWMATLCFKFQWSTKSTSIKWPKWWHNQWTRLPSTIFRSILCLELFFFFCFFVFGVFFYSLLFLFLFEGGCIFHSPSALFMLRGELRAKLIFRWKNVFSKEKILVKSFIFWWNSLNWFLLCKMKNSCFHEFYVTFCIVRNVTKI